MSDRFDRSARGARAEDDERRGNVLMRVVVARRAVRRWLMAGAAVGVALIAYNTFTVRIHEREAGVLLSWGAFGRVVSPGLVFVTPIVNSVEIFDLTIRSVEMSKLETFTEDGQHVDVNMVVQYQLDRSQVERVFRETPDYEKRLITMAIDRMKIALGHRNAAQLPAQRGQVTAEVFAAISKEAERLFGVRVLDVQIINIDYSANFRAAIDASAVAKAGVERAHNLQNSAKVEADTAKITAAGQAEAAIEQARGQAETRRLVAKAEADAIILRGEAEARVIAVRGEADGKAITAQATALASAGPAYVQLEVARRWTGNLPQQMLAGTPVPLLPLTTLGR